MKGFLAVGAALVAALFASCGGSSESSCSPSSCAGCCLDGVCEPGSANNACGMGGARCDVCASSQVCMGSCQFGGAGGGAGGSTGGGSTTGGGVGGGGGSSGCGTCNPGVHQAFAWVAG